MALRQIFADNLRRARELNGMSQEALADAAGIDRTYVSALERGLYSVSLDTLEKLASALNVTPSWLLEKASDRA
jgi:transcriptional regulator with XRE-family HTH domain